MTSTNYLLLVVAFLLIIVVNIQDKKVNKAVEKAPKEAPIVSDKINEEEPQKDVVQKNNEDVTPPPQEKQMDEIPPVTPVEEPKEPQNVIYAKNLDDAKNLSKKYNKKILLYFHAPWCHNCEAMMNYFGQKQVKEAMMNYIVLMCNTDVDRDTAKMYNIHWLPTYIVADSNGKIIKSGSGLIEAKSFINWLNPSSKAKALNKSYYNHNHPLNNNPIHNPFSGNSRGI